MKILMQLTDADAVALLTPFGIALPQGIETASADIALTGDGPWMVKAQIATAGRGDDGGIVHCTSLDDVTIALTTLLGRPTVATCLVEPVQQGDEHTLTLTLDPLNYGLRVSFDDTVRDCSAHPGAVAEALSELATTQRTAVVETGRALAEAMIRHELTLAGLRLFLSDTGCTAACPKAVADLAALPRQPVITALLRARPAAYAETLRRLDEGVDIIPLDPQGEVAIITAGAGLSAVLAEDVATRGHSVAALYTMRTGQVRGDPAPLGRALARIAAHPALKAVLVNDFAGMTDLAVFATRLAAAIDATPALTVPVVARLAGHDAAEARRILASRQPGMVVTDDLETAMRALGKAA